MNQEKIDEYKGKLETERAEVLKELSKEQKPEDFGSDIDDFDEEKNEAESFSNQVAISQDLKNRLEDIEVALGKIKDGKYGICENCGKEIETEVLNVSPESRLCKHCKASK